MKILIAGSVREKIPTKYIEETEKLGEFIAKKGDSVICCADQRGIIGGVYKKIKENNACKISLTMPKAYARDSTNIDEVEKITDTINQRTDYLLQNSDVGVFLPGGIGTIYELLSAIETKRAGEHNSEIIIVNSFGFFNKLLEMLDKVYDEKFANIENKDVYYIANSTEDAIRYIENIKRGE